MSATANPPEPTESAAKRRLAKPTAPPKLEKILVPILLVAGALVAILAGLVGMRRFLDV